MIVKAKPTSVYEHPTCVGRVAIVWRGDAVARRDATPETSRFKAVFAALAKLGVDARAVVYEDDVADAVRDQLSAFDGVLVWVNPIHNGRNRTRLDANLRDVAASGVWVSAHPDVILKMGTKEVLYRTRAMAWGCDTAIYPTAEVMREELPARLRSGARVIKQNRGNDGQGVFKVELLESAAHSQMLRVLDASKDAPEELTLDEFMNRCAAYFATGCLIDQAFQPRLGEGVIRCYMAGERCAGFGHHHVKALVEEPRARSLAGPRIYTSSADPRFQRLRCLMEEMWTPELMAVLGIASHDLPMIWDADFMLGPPDSSGHDTYVLGEINVSSVFAIPDEAPGEIARRVLNRLHSTRVQRRAPTPAFP